ncbi:MAG TPA: N-acetyltransferase [Vicinamibacteria bacterium]|nr:N-acetyltransferase [Vicinamibacteria bacterium]
MSGAAAVTPVEGARDRRAFVALPYGLHRSDPNWPPLLRRDVRAMLDPQRNPFFAHGEAGYFLARRDGRVVGRIASIRNRLHDETHRDGAGFFGFFESEDDPQVASSLLDAASGWLCARGCQRLRGPISFSINDDAGLLVDGFDTPAALMMPHNPRYYPALVEAAGLAGVKDLIVYQGWRDRLPERLAEAEPVIAKRYGVRVRTLDLARFAEDVRRVKELFNLGWERNWGFVPFTDREIDHLAAQLRPIVVPELVLFAEVEGMAVGFLAALPDLNQALRANPSGRLFPGLARVWWAARRITRLRVLLLGTRPEWRGRGIDALLYKRVWDEAGRLGYDWGEAGWVLEDNLPMRNALERMGFERYKTYRIYERPL